MVLLSVKRRKLVPAHIPSMPRAAYPCRASVIQLNEGLVIKNVKELRAHWADYKAEEGFCKHQGRCRYTDA